MTKGIGLFLQRSYLPTSCILLSLPARMQVAAGTSHTCALLEACLSGCFKNQTKGGCQNYGPFLDNGKENGNYYVVYGGYIGFRV